LPSPIYDTLREAICEGDGERVTAGEIVDALGPRAFGLSIIVIMAPVCLPMPPGVPTVAGVVLAMFAIQLILGFKHPWLPGWIRRLSIRREKLLAGLDGLEKRLGWVDGIARPRLRFMTYGIGARLIGLVLLVLAGILILPIPFLGNLPPALAASVLALALAQRDGLIAIVGFLASALAITFMWTLIATTARWIVGVVAQA
jgi:hypothetical protein